MAAIITGMVLIVLSILLYAFLQMWQATGMITSDFSFNGTTILIIFGVFLVIYILAIYNKFVKLKNNVHRSKSTIDVYLKKRFDLIPNLVETVKKYSKYEENILTSLIELRASFELSKKDDIKEDEALYNKCSTLIGIIENYPELKAIESYKILMKELSEAEDDLQAARRIYNVEVTEYNTAIAKVPANIVAKIFRYKEKSYFEISESIRQNINISEEINK